MAVLWGFNFSEVSMKAFGLKEMMDKKWYLRKERIIAYQTTMLICMGAQTAAIFSVFKYNDSQKNVAKVNPSAMENNNDIVNTGIIAVLFSVLPATLFSLEFMILLFWPGRVYRQTYNRVKSALGVGMCAGMIAASVLSSIIVGTREGSITGVDENTANELKMIFFRPPLEYNAYPPNLAYVVLLWIGTICTITSTIYLIKAAKNDDQIVKRRFTNTVASNSPVPDEEKSVGTTEIRPVAL